MVCSMLWVNAENSKLAETFAHMEHLFQFSWQNPQLTASDALRQLVTSYQTQPQAPLGFNPALNHHNGLNPNFQQPPGQRTPGFGGPNHFASPATAHLNLPISTTSASPATLNMSPAMQNHVLHIQQQAPTSVGMVAQQSHQGTNTSAGTGSQGTSANTSPNVPHKRRRPSAVKVEADDGGGSTEINGTGPKVKPSPRIGGGAKRQKGGG